MRCGASLFVRPPVGANLSPIKSALQIDCRARQARRGGKVISVIPFFWVVLSGFHFLGWSCATPPVGATMEGHRSGISGTDLRRQRTPWEVCPIQFQPRSWTARAFPTRPGNSGTSCRGTTTPARTRPPRTAKQGLLSAERLGSLDQSPSRGAIQSGTLSTGRAPP